MKKKLISEKKINALGMIVGICLFIIPITSCSFSKNSTDDLSANSANKEELLSKQTINNNAANPQEIVEEFVRFVSSNDLENANSYVTFESESLMKNEGEIQEVPQPFNWVPEFQRLNLILVNTLSQEINEDKSTVDVVLENKELKNKMPFRFYLRKANSEWRIYQFKLLGSKLLKRDRVSYLKH